MYKIVIAIGTRPEVIKMAPLIKRLSVNSSVDLHVIDTGQHPDMFPLIAKDFGLDIGIRFPIKLNNNLARLSAITYDNMSNYIGANSPDLVIVHGDTTTAMACALASFNAGVKVAHVEAGLRSYDTKSPWPEEANRRIIDVCSDLLFAPTVNSLINLESENLSGKILQVGNTIVDSLNLMISKLSEHPNYEFVDQKVREFCQNGSYILATLHRRENIGENLGSTLKAILRLSEMGMRFIIPVHKNPDVRSQILNRLEGVHNVLLIEPQGYLAFLQIMRNSSLIITDSGGIQEEAISMSKRVLVARENTERPEGLETGMVELIGVDTEKLVAKVVELSKINFAFDDSVINPYGDGTSSQRIEKEIISYLEGI